MPENILQIIIRARDEATKTLKITDKQLKDVGESVSKAGSKFLIAGTAMAAGLGVAIKKAGDFQEQMSFVATMLGDQSEKYMPGFESALKSMATTYGQSTATLSKGLYDILSASISAEEATKFLETSVRAAEAGFVDAGLTADALTTVVNAYSLSADRAGDISDWFFSIVEKGKTTMGELAPSIGLVLPLAKSLGVSLEDVGASLTVMTRAGIKTDIAVTSLKAIMGAFLKPTKELITLTKEWGFASSQAAMKELGMAEVVERLSKVESVRLPQLIVEKTALTGLLTILDKKNEFMKDSISISERAGKTDEMLAKRQNDLNVQMRKLRETVNILMVEVGTALIPVIKELAERIVENIDKFRDFVKENAGLIKNVAILTPAILLLSGAFLKIVGTGLKMVSVISKLIPLIKTLGLTTGGIPVIIAGAVAAVALLTVEFIKAKKSIEDFNEASEKQLDQIDKQIDKAKEWEGTHKALLLVKANLIQRGYDETSSEIKNLDLRIAKLKEKARVEKETSEEVAEKTGEITDEKTKKQLELEEELREEIEFLRAGESEKETIRLEDSVEKYRKEKADEGLIDELLDLKRAEIAEKRIEREKAIAGQIMDTSSQLIGSLLQGEIERAGAETAQGKSLAKAKILIEQGVAVAKVWAAYAGFLPPLGPILATAQTGLIISKMTRQISRIEGMEKGGIVTKPTIALLGEKGPEAVIPLKAGARATAINVIIQFPSVTTFSDWEAADPARIKEVTRRKLLPAFKDLAREGLVI